MILPFRDTVKHIADAISATFALATLVQILPAIAATMSIIWYGLRIWDWMHNKKSGDD